MFPAVEAKENKTIHKPDDEGRPSTRFGNLAGYSKYSAALNIQPKSDNHKR